MHAMTKKNATWREMCEAYLVTETDEDDGDETAAQDRWWLVLGTMKMINAGSFFLLVFLCFFEMMKPLCSPPLRLSLPFSFCFSLLYTPLSFSLLSLSVSSLFFMCFAPCSALLSSPSIFFLSPRLLSVFFCVFLSLLPPVSIVSPSVFFVRLSLPSSICLSSCVSSLSPLLSRFFSPPSSLVSFLHLPLVQYILWLL